ncbi:putative leader peptide [Streptomyces sp. NPDC014861]
MGRYVRAMSRTALLTTRGHIDLLRVASATCSRGC